MLYRLIAHWRTPYVALILLHFGVALSIWQSPEAGTPGIIERVYDIPVWLAAVGHVLGGLWCMVCLVRSKPCRVAWFMVGTTPLLVYIWAAVMVWLNGHGNLIPVAFSAAFYLLILHIYVVKNGHSN